MGYAWLFLVLWIPGFSCPALQATPSSGPVIPFPEKPVQGMAWSEQKNTKTVAVAQARTTQARFRARMDMAVFLLGTGHWLESFTHLSALESGDPGVTLNPLFRAVRGAAFALTGKHKNSLEDFSVPGLSGRAEIEAWKRVCRLHLISEDPARVPWEQIRTGLQIFPRHIFETLVVASARQAHMEQNYALIQPLLDMLEGQYDPGFRTEYHDLMGYSAFWNQDDERACLFWSPLARQNPVPWKGLNTLADVRARMHQKTPPPPAESLKRLEEARAWLVHEPVTGPFLETRARLHEQAGQTVLVLATWLERHALQNPPDQNFRAECSRAARNLLDDASAFQTAPLKALAHLEKWITHLDPPTPEEEHLLVNTVKRLVMLGMNEQAHTALARYEPRIQNPAALNLCTALHVILDYEKHEREDLPDDVRTRASPVMARTHDLDPAVRYRLITALARRAINTGEEIPVAENLLRAWPEEPTLQELLAALYRKTHRWEEAMVTEQGLLDPQQEAQPDNPVWRRRVLNLALCAFALNQKVRKEHLSKTWGPAMVQTPDARLFALLTGTDLAPPSPTVP
jgi:hypothetical protein